MSFILCLRNLPSFLLSFSSAGFRHLGCHTTFLHLLVWRQSPVLFSAGMKYTFAGHMFHRLHVLMIVVLLSVSDFPTGFLIVVDPVENYMARHVSCISVLAVDRSSKSSLLRYPSHCLDTRTIACEILLESTRICPRDGDGFGSKKLAGIWRNVPTAPL